MGASIGHGEAGTGREKRVKWIAFMYLRGILAVFSVRAKEEIEREKTCIRCAGSGVLVDFVTQSRSSACMAAERDGRSRAVRRRRDLAVALRSNARSLRAALVRDDKGSFVIRFRVVVVSRDDRKPDLGWGALVS